MQRVFLTVIEKIRSLKLPFAWCFLISTSVFIQQGPQDFIQRYNISFPIRELGNCASYTECRNFCEDPLNQEACTNYARAKRMIRGTPLSERDSSVLDVAKKELGCDSHESCEAFCEEPKNYERCNSFAQRYALAGGYVTSPSEGQILAKARSVLGCSSYETCKLYCEDGRNRAKCTEFARQAGLRGGSEARGPGGCTSEASCQAYCSNPNNFEECKAHAVSENVSFRGPGGCDSPQACSIYCREHPQECHGFSLIPYTPSDPILACTKIAGCSWSDNTCQCKGSMQSLEEVCRQTPGCSWTGSTCVCPNYTPYPTHIYYTPAPTYAPEPTAASTPTPAPTSSGSTSTDYESECKKTSGCEWRDNTCYCTSTSDSDAKSKCESTSGCTWKDNTCQCAHGVSTSALVSEKQLKERGITFPIGQLGECNDCGSCQSFCEDPANREACIAFAKEKGLFEEEQEREKNIFERAKAELGCDSQESCKLFCQKEENFQSCQLFAAKYELTDSPAILTPTSGAVVSGTQTIEVKAGLGASLELFLQIGDLLGDAIFVGRATLSGEENLGRVSWDSTSAPNGTYKLITIVTPQGGSPQTVGPISITVNNPPALGFAPITVEDVVLPSQFDPGKISVDPTSTIISATPEIRDEKPAIVLQGRAVPNTIVTLVIYTTPIIVTVKTDANGLWSYTLEKPLEAGEHTAYIVVSRPDGTKARSESSSFIVPAAFAAVPGDEGLELQSAEEPQSLRVFIYVTIMIVALALTALLLLYRLKTKSSQ